MFPDSYPFYMKMPLKIVNKKNLKKKQVGVFQKFFGFHPVSILEHAGWLIMWAWEHKGHIVLRAPCCRGELGSKRPGNLSSERLLGFHPRGLS